MAACQSPAVAEALIRRAGIEKQEFEKLMEERRAMFREMREHDERVFDKAASTAAEAARHPGTSNIVNK
jgi:hypothetical protein